MEKDPNVISVGPEWKIVSETYSLEKLLGKGSFGMVILSKHRATDQTVAIKYIACDFSNLQATRNVLREISLLS